MNPREPDSVEPQAVRELPTMAQLDQLSADLDDVDAVLARMDAHSPGSVDETTTGDPTDGSAADVD